MSVSAYYRKKPIHKEFSFSPDALWEVGLKYFKWVQDNPLKEEKPVGKAIKKLSKMRAMSKKAFCLFANISEDTFANYLSDKEPYKEHFGIAKKIEAIIYSQKFEGAAADLLNSSIIARDLGLVDKKDLTSAGEKIEPTTIQWGDKIINL